MLTNQKKVFRHFRQNWNIRPFTQYFVETPLTTITASSLLGYDTRSFSHLYLENFSHSSLQNSQALSSWMGSVTAQLFSGISRDVHLGWSPNSVWAIQGHSETCPEATSELSWLCASGRCPSPQSESLSALEQVFIKDLSVFCSVPLCLNPD